MQAVLEALDPQIALISTLELEKLEPNTVYRSADPFFCSYLFFLLPGIEPDQVMFIGPLPGTGTDTAADHGTVGKVGTACADIQ